MSEGGPHGRRGRRRRCRRWRCVARSLTWIRNKERRVAVRHAGRAQPLRAVTSSMDPSPSQALAIEAEPRSLLVLAGPGAGKTFCLTERIRFLIERHRFDPARICAFTFTNKAAGEIAVRLERRLDKAAE